MQTQTVLYIILAAVLALIVVLFQYYYKQKIKGKAVIGLSFLRFIAIFGVLLLLINPKFSKNEYLLEKANLVFLIDDSSSIKKEAKTVQKLISEITEDVEVNKNFSIKKYSFGQDFREQKDSLTFLEENTNIAKALMATEEIYARTNTAILLLTDGNQTIGEDYQYTELQEGFGVFPICVGDTTRYDDIRIERIINNPYSFLKNQFPIEVIVNYEGNSSVNKTLAISLDGKKIHQENISVSGNNNSKTVAINLKAESVGVKYIQASIGTLDNEKNIVNNKKISTLEVIDETTKVAIITNTLHPDIGTLRKAIESNEQRRVLLLSPETKEEDLEKIDLFILYKPNTEFTSVYDYIKKKKASSFTITGVKTNWSFFNKMQPHINVENGYPIQEVLPIKNLSFSKFDISQFNTTDYPPLDTDSGPMTFSENMEPLMSMSIKGINVGNPLFIVSDSDNKKDAFLFGENIWKWRMQDYRNSKNFKNFDEFISKIVVYLSSSKTKKRLNVDYKTVYQGSTNTKITATYFDESYSLDTNASMQISIKNRNTGEKQEVPMLLKSNFFEVDLAHIPPGDYDFTISVLDKNYSTSGKFTILKFDMEEQFLSSNARKLKALATSNDGQLFFPNQTLELKNNLLENKAFLPVQKRIENIVPLVDFKILLGIIAAALALEWFIRKYNGLI